MTGLIKSSNSKVALNDGCGEGYYLNQLLQFNPDLRASESCGYGFDISKPAIQLASHYK